jgi:NPCBM/NEW2 domain
VRPQAVKQIGQFDEAFAAVDDRNLHGGFLTVAGAHAERGLGCQARCELSFSLDGGYSALVGAVGIEDDAGALGAAAFQVFVDGKVAFNVGARAGLPAQPMVVPLAGAKLLQLVVDFGGGGLAGAADWCWPCLVRGVTPGG